MNLPESPIAELPRPVQGAMKFTYASGSRPLEGYTIKRGVGRGGFGEVYFATSDAGKEVALKLIRRNMDVELRGATQCLNLKHPNLIALYDIRTDEMEDQWIIMEYVSGESLEDVIERNPNGMPVDQVLAWMRGLCAGVGYLHDHGIVHRDLKPGNIFVDEGTVKIGDYGLAKFISCSRRSGQTESVGTVHYMAPEIANGRYGREIDTYALGIILFEMLTGTVPFEGESVGEVLMKHLTAEPDLSRLAEPYRDIVRRALAKDPEVRIKNVNEIVALLPGGGGAALATEQISDVVLTPIRPAAKAASPAGAGNAQYVRNVNPAVIGPIEEPIMKAVRDGLDRLLLNGDAIDPQRRAQKLAITWAVFILAFVAAGMLSRGFAFAIGFYTLFIYAIYYCIWKLFIRPSIERHAYHAAASPPYGRANVAAEKPGPSSPNAAPRASQIAYATAPPIEAVPGATTPAARYAQQVRRKRMRANWREKANQQLADKPFRDKLRELTGSMLLAAVIAALVSIAMPALSPSGPQMSLWASYMWLSLVGTLGAWAVLVPAKLSEGKLEDQMPMRLVMLLLGSLVGVISWGIGDFLLVNLPRGEQPLDGGEGLLSQGMLGLPRPPAFHTVTGNPSLQTYVLYFACLFLVVQWWKRTEYTRPSRLSLWSVAGCVFAAWLAHFLWWFPQPAGMMVAGTVAVAAQLASPWMPPSRRRALSEEVEQTTA